MEKTMDKIVALAKSRGFVYPGSEIYGGLANTWDYGNLGVELKNNVKLAIFPTPCLTYCPADFHTVYPTVYLVHHTIEPADASSIQCFIFMLYIVYLKQFRYLKCYICFQRKTLIGF